MNYELAKKLKDAGFPQRKEIIVNGFGSQVDDRTEEGLTIPTLSELIEACGDKFWKLEFYSKENEWIVDGFGRNEFAFRAQVGSTPEKAVAELWLALNPEKKQ